MSIFDNPSVDVKFIKNYNDSYNMKYKKGQIISVRKCPGNAYVAVLGQGDFQDIPNDVVIEISTLQYSEYSIKNTQPSNTKNINSRYTRDGKYLSKIPVCSNVGDLKVLLSKLPDDLPIEVGGSEVKPVWKYVGLSIENLSFHENDGSWE